MTTYKFNNATVNVIDCACPAVDFRVVEVFDNMGMKVCDCRTSEYGQKAAAVGYAKALRFRLI